MIARNRLTIRDTNRIKPLRAAVLSLIQECGKPDPNITKIVSAIESDPIITMRVLAMANSPLFGCTREINSINRAIVILGLKSISNLAVILGTEQSVKASAGSVEKKRWLFEHLLGCGIVARKLAMDAPRIDPGEAFVAGVLHDIGKLLFLSFSDCGDPESEDNISDDDRLEFEREYFGVEHQQIGCRYAELIGLPPQIAQAIGNHQRGGEENSLQSIVWQANRLCREWNIGPHFNFKSKLNSKSRQTDDDRDRASAIEEFETIRGALLN